MTRLLFLGPKSRGSALCPTRRLRRGSPGCLQFPAVPRRAPWGLYNSLWTSCLQTLRSLCLCSTPCLHVPQLSALTELQESLRMVPISSRASAFPFECCCQTPVCRNQDTRAKGAALGRHPIFLHL